jgi:hypothetical protein
MLYGFKKQFVDPILDGRKGGTIRVTRKGGGDRPGGHARPGETLHLYYGLRTRQCTKITEKMCIGSVPIAIHFDPKPLVHIALSEQRKMFFSTPAELDAFAVFDGFAAFEELAAFWRATHGPVKIFDGWHIRWLPLPGENEPPWILPLESTR